VVDRPFGSSAKRCLAGCVAIEVNLSPTLHALNPQFLDDEPCKPQFINLTVA
jgi:hypothetical protein